jgi:protein-disulfide isomerase
MAESDSPSPSPIKSKGLSFNPLVVILVAAAFIIGVLYTRTQNLEQQLGKTDDQSAQVAGQQVQPTSPPPAGNQGAGQQFGSADQVDPLQEDDWVRGSRDARVLLIEYSDVDCPFCKRFHPTAQQAVDEYDGQVAWVYRHFPLAQLHPDAPKKAEATECAGEQQGNDGFWKLVDKLSDSSSTVTLEQIPQVATSLGLDGAQIKSCMDSGKFTSKVSDHQQSGVKAGVTGTPGNILLDTQTGQAQLIPGAVPFEQLKTAIDAMLAS